MLLIYLVFIHRAEFYREGPSSSKPVALTNPTHNPHHSILTSPSSFSEQPPGPSGLHDSSQSIQVTSRELLTEDHRLSKHDVGDVGSGRKSTREGRLGSGVRALDIRPYVRKRKGKSS